MLHYNYVPKDMSDRFHNDNNGGFVTVNPQHRKKNLAMSGPDANCLIETSRQPDFRGQFQPKRVKIFLKKYKNRTGKEH